MPTQMWYCAAGCGAETSPFVEYDASGYPKLPHNGVPAGWWQVHARGEILAACSRRCAEHLGGRPGTMFLPIEVPSCGSCYWFNAQERAGDGSPLRGFCGLTSKREPKQAMQVCPSWGGDDHIICEKSVFCEGRPVAPALDAKGVREVWERDGARRAVLEEMLQHVRVRCPSCATELRLNGSTVYPEHEKSAADILNDHGAWDRATPAQRRCPGSGRPVPMATGGAAPVDPPRVGMEAGIQVADHAHFGADEVTPDPDYDERRAPVPLPMLAPAATKPGTARVREGQMEVFDGDSWLPLEEPPPRFPGVPAALSALEPDPADRKPLEPGEIVFHKITGQRWVAVQPGGFDSHEIATYAVKPREGDKAWDVEQRPEKVAIEDAWLCDDGSGPPYTRFPRALLTRRAINCAVALPTLPPGDKRAGIIGRWFRRVFGR